MEKRTVIALTAVACIALIGAYTAYDGSKTADKPITAPKLGPVAQQKNTTKPVKLEHEVPLAKTPVADGLEKESKAPKIVVPQEKLSHLYIVKCSACHGRDGNGPVGPSIAGKSYEYNLKKLIEYKKGQVENTMMADLLTRTDEKELQNLAKEISNFKTSTINEQK